MVSWVVLLCGALGMWVFGYLFSLLVVSCSLVCVSVCAGCCYVWLGMCVVVCTCELVFMFIVLLCTIAIACVILSYFIASCYPRPFLIVSFS